MKTRRLIIWVKTTVLFTIVVLSIGSATTAAASLYTSKGIVCVQGEYLRNAASYLAAGDVFGYFFIKGKAPVGFTNIEYLSLGGDGEFGAGAKPPYYGDIHLTGKGKTTYLLLKPTLVGNSLSFQTEAVAGVSYKFEGTLTQTDFTNNEPDGDAVVLTGTMTKLKKGKSIGQAKLKFTWSVGD